MQSVLFKTQNVYIITILLLFSAATVTDQTCNVMRDSQLSASIFTRKQLTSTGANRMAATLQEAAAACQEVGLDILHYIPERNCSNLDNNSATRDLNARKLNRYAITCQRK